VYIILSYRSDDNVGFGVVVGTSSVGVIAFLNQKVILIHNEKAQEQ
jgi:hypothetical protein